jgi:hypothetical protein
LLLSHPALARRETRFAARFAGARTATPGAGTSAAQERSSSMNASAFTAPATIGARLLFLGYLLAVVASVALTDCAIGTGSWRIAGQAFVSLLLALLIRHGLLSPEAFNACVNEGEPVAVPEESFTGELAAAADRLRTLLALRDSLETQRASAHFDPWESLAVRRQIAAHVRQHPQLTSLAERHGYRD